nr:DUF2892 domain-containing protein [uncultured Sphaerochaeta sp.]
MTNMGKTDRTLRLAAGIVLIVLAVILQVSTGRLWWLGLPGLLMVFTGSIAFCPLYVPLKINTRNRTEG